MSSTVWIFAWTTPIHLYDTRLLPGSSMGSTVYNTVILVQVERRCQTCEIADDLRIIGPVQSIESVSGHIQGALLEHDMAVPVDFKHSVVILIADQGVPIPQADRARRKRI